MLNEDPLPPRHSAETIMEGQPPSPPPSLTEDDFEPLPCEIPPGSVHPDIEDTAKLAYISALRFYAMWSYRIQDQAGTDRDVQPQLRPTTYEMIMTLIALEGPKPLPTGPLPPPTAPARPPFQLGVPPDINIEDCVKDLEAVVYAFYIPDSLRQLFTELGQTIWSNEWLRYFLIRQPHRPTLGADTFYGVLRWWLCTDEVIITALLEHKWNPRSRAEVNYYIPAAQGIRRYKERNEMWSLMIEEVAKVRRKLDAGISTVFHEKLAEERDLVHRGTPPPTRRKRRAATRSRLNREIGAQTD